MLDSTFHVFRITLAIAHVSPHVGKAPAALWQQCDVKQAQAQVLGVGRTAARHTYKPHPLFLSVSLAALTIQFYHTLYIHISTHINHGIAQDANTARLCTAESPRAPRR